MSDLAKMDASDSNSLLNPGCYYVIPARGDLAKMDAFSCKYFLIPET
jgi:hypothetical protein